MHPDQMVQANFEQQRDNHPPIGCQMNSKTLTSRLQVCNWLYQIPAMRLLWRLPIRLDHFLGHQRSIAGSTI